MGCCLASAESKRWNSLNDPARSWRSSERRSQRADAVVGLQLEVGNQSHGGCGVSQLGSGMDCWEWFQLIQGMVASQWPVVTQWALGDGEQESAGRDGALCSLQHRGVAKTASGTCVREKKLGKHEKYISKKEKK